ncbi:hypothetical protein WJX72_004057 [[Myrmecia] bisecta]|uniref:Major facilitator superfamily (MFS) profile domain-containing protein n=1 Tax=[Myrmecia] bisecta TaxID=41462 RepID=A0AAW1P9H9_9CHLO
MQALTGREEVTVDEALQRSVGEFGWGQRKLFLLVSLAGIPAGLQTMLLLFVGADPVRQHLWECTIAGDEQCQREFGQTAPNLCSLPSASWRWTQRYDSVVSEWDLICGSAWAAQAINMAFFGGCLLGGLLLGAAANRFGRKTALFTSCLLMAFLGSLCSLAPSFWWYVLLRSATGVGVGGLGRAAFLLATEPIGPSWRGLAGLYTHAFFAMGAALAPLLALLVPAWRPLTFLSAAATCLYLLFTPSIPESPRWLLAAGRKGEATSALAAIASLNKTHLPEAPLADPAFQIAQQRGLAEVLMHARLRRRLLVMLATCWTVVLAYTALTLSINGLAGSPYLNQLLAFLVELPAISLAGLLLDRIGRRSTLMYSLLHGGLAAVLCALTRGWLQRVCACACKFGVAAALCMTHTYTSELFPTTVRASALEAAMLVAGMGSIMAPGLVLLAKFAEFVPFVACAVALCLAGLSVMALPETLGLPSAETIQEMAAPTSRRFRLPGIRQILRLKSHSHTFFTRLADSDIESSQ